MTDLAAWEAHNNAYLAAALAWLRVRLEQAAQARGFGAASGVSAAVEPPPPNAGRSFFRRRSLLASAADAPLLLQPPRTSGPADLAAAETALAETAVAEPSPALITLSRQLGLSEFERDVLLLCLAPELDPGITAAITKAQGGLRDYPTFGLAMSLFANPAWEVLSPERPLRYWRLVEISQPGARPLTSSELRADERILNHIKGLVYLDDRLAPLLTPVQPPASGTLPESQREVADRVARLLTHDGGQPSTVLLLGKERGTAEEVIAVAAAALGLRLFRLTAADLPPHLGDIETLARLWDRETLLAPNLLLIDAHELDSAGGTEGPAARLVRFLNRSAAPRCVAAADGAPAGVEQAPVVEVGKPLPAEQRALWHRAITDVAPDQAEDLAAQLAGQFDLDQHAIHAACAEAAEGTAEGLRDRLWLAGRRKSRPFMERLAEKLDAKARWEDIVLPGPETDLLHRIAEQVRLRARVYDEGGFRARMNRGLGISVLFAGDSGTGKTMAAEVLANALQLDLYRIDLSAVVSKYIGETEKNLRRVFDAAEGGGAILFFDEADAIFGKRSEVKDSHDRYANIEINYLLQRMEAYRGLAILATNMKSALDPAFLRRLRFVVEFPFPAPAERRRIWERAFPPETRIEGLDLDRLARFPVTGGSIHNVALGGAFLAAGAGSPVTMPHVLEAARAEFRKLERPVSEAEFRVATAVEGRA